MTRLVVIDASLSESGSSTRLARELWSHLPAHWERTHIQLRLLARDLADSLLVGFATPPLERAYEAVGMADAAVVVTPIYQSSYSGLLKLFLDLLPEGALAGVPAIAAATGGSTRHALAVDHSLRPLLTYLRAEVVPAGIYAAAEDWGVTAADSSGDEEGGLGRRVRRAARQLAAAVAAKAPQPQGAPEGGVAGREAGGTSSPGQSAVGGAMAHGVGAAGGTSATDEAESGADVVDTTPVQQAQTAAAWKASVRGDQLATFTPFEELLAQVNQ